MSEIEMVVRGSKRVEGLLEERLGASGRGLHEKVTSVEPRLPPEVVRSIRWIATVRNKVVHEEGSQALDAEEFVARVDDAVEWLSLNAVSQPGQTTGNGDAATTTTSDGLEHVKGRVTSLRRIGRPPEVLQGLKAECVHVELVGLRRIIELVVQDPVVINHGDEVTIAGEPDPVSGKLKGYAYRNLSRGIFGQHSNTRTFGLVFVAAGLAFAWAIFPLFFHLRVGFKLLRLGRKVQRSVELVNAAM